MAFKKPTTHTAVPESPDRLFRDLPRRKHASLYDHQGQVLRNYVQSALNSPDVALQLPTGSGKTLVGLLLAEWRRRRFGERVVYLCPTSQLVNQVADEASLKYGLVVEPFTGKIKEYTPQAKASYEGGDHVAVTNYSSLFNVNPFFKNPDIIIADDAHAAENYVAKQWSLQIYRFDENHDTLFKAVVSVLKPVLPSASYARLISQSDKVEDTTWVDKVPTHKLREIIGELHAAVAENVGDLDLRYQWRMLEDHLHACQLYISSTHILLRPLIPPTWSHAPFSTAKQRIFMSATLGLGGDLERLTGRPNIMRLAIPEGWDRQGIGRRFFFFPEKSLDESGVTSLSYDLMKAAGRSLVLTPSDAQAKLIKTSVESELQCAIFSADDLEDSKSEFTKTSSAVAVVANRYDGIDFPDDDCRLLFIDGLPSATNLQERFLMNRMGANVLFNERIQTRVLQAIGRCTRGLNDYSAVVVGGDDLGSYLTDSSRRKYFHPELQAELKFGIDQSSETDASNMLENFNTFLDHGKEWEEANQGILEMRELASQADFPAMRDLEKVVANEIAWQKSMWNQDFVKAYEASREVLGGLNHPDLRGYRALWHYLAGSAAEIAAENDPAFKSEASTQFTKAKDAANGIPWLITLARARPVTESVAEQQMQAKVMSQIEQLESQLVKLGRVHNRGFAAREREIREGLKNGTTFEVAQVKLGEHLGFTAGKREEDASPDPWWAVDNQIIVFEDHANADADGAIIDATKARQAASHPNWIRENVPGAANEGAIIQSVLVTPAKKATAGALPHLADVAYWDLADFREWAEQVLNTIRELRETFRAPGDLAWRADAASALDRINATAPKLFAWLSERSARKFLDDTFSPL